MIWNWIYLILPVLFISAGIGFTAYFFSVEFEPISAARQIGYTQTLLKDTGTNSFEFYSDYEEGIYPALAGRYFQNPWNNSDFASRRYVIVPAGNTNLTAGAVLLYGDSRRGLYRIR